MKQQIRTVKEGRLKQMQQQIRTIKEGKLRTIKEKRRPLVEELDSLIVQCDDLEAIIAKENSEAKPAMERRNAWHKLDVWKSGCIAQQRELEVCAQCADISKQQ